ncbi:MAG: HYR domain-containing protein [Sphingobacteriales bacterium JAD_PAG50586_3]|nr:MAG: HYR domain-containing protein [Sphingobacteriales bacterium JAD_PAG50586_3]
MNNYYRKMFLLTCISILLVQSCIAQGGLIAYYPCNGDANDDSGNNNTGVLKGGVTTTADRFGNPCGALMFNGSDGYVEVPNSKSLQSPQSSFSLACWVKLEGYQNTSFKWLTLICKGDNTTEKPNNPQYRCQTFQNNSQSTVSINTDFTEYDLDFSSHPFKIGQWAFYTLVYNGSVVIEYIDGVKVWEFPYASSLEPNNSSLFIGKDIPGALEFFYGSLDDIRIYNTAINNLKISQLYSDKSGATFTDGFTITCPSDIKIVNNKGECYATVKYENPKLLITCNTATFKLINGKKSGSDFSIGDNYITYEATSSTGISKTCNLKITVEDNEAPIINCKNDTTLFIDAYSIKNSLPYSYNLPVATDNCFPVNVQLTRGIKSGAEFPIGNTLLEFTATDNSGNSKTCSYTVTVKKNVIKADIDSTTKNKAIIIDKIDCPSDITKINDYGKCGSIVTYSLTDSEPAKLKLIEGKRSGVFFEVGETPTKYQKLLNTGNTAECFFNVTVIDREKPVIRCPNDTILYINKGEFESRLNFKNITATDNCSIKDVLQIAGMESGSKFPLGITTNAYKVIDIYGNTAQCGFKISVLEKQDLQESKASIVKPINPITGEKIIVHKTERLEKVDYIADLVKFNAEELKFDDCNLTLEMYDDREEDGDTISVFLMV